MKTLVYESNFSGHRKEWLLSLWDYSEKIREAQVDRPVEFLLHPNLITTIIEERKLSARPQNLHAIQQDQLLKFASAKTAWRRGDLESKHLALFLRNHAFHRLLLMYVNVLQLHLRRLRDITIIDGILFNHLYLPRGKRRGNLAIFRKLLQYTYMTWTPKLGNVFVLEDQESVSSYNKCFLLKPVFSVLRDPVNNEVLRYLSHDSKSSNSIQEPHVLRLLAFGTIEKRKGVDLFLKAVCELCSRTIPYSIQISLLGRFTDRVIERAVNELIEQCMASGENAGNTINFHRIHDYVPEHILAKELNQCTSVHLGYNGFTGSSGVLGLSAAARKPVIACNEGLIGHTVAVNGLGPVVNVHDSVAYADAIDDIAMARFKYNVEAADRLVAERTATAFAQSLLNPPIDITFNG